MQTMGLFPLNVVLFPGLPLNLHIFEPRYRRLIRACLDANQAFGVVLIHKGMEALGPPAEPYAVGCSARITAVDRLPDGRMNITVVGDERFRIESLESGAPGSREDYLRGVVVHWPLENPHALEVLRGVRRLAGAVRHYLRGLSSVVHEEPDLSAMDLPEDAHALLYLAASLLQIPAVEKQPLLEAANASVLLEHLERLYRRELALLTPPPDFNEDAARRSSWLN